MYIVKKTLRIICENDQNGSKWHTQTDSFIFGPKKDNLQTAQNTINRFE
jgi:hypothetical protein